MLTDLQNNYQTTNVPFHLPHKVHDLDLMFKIKMCDIREQSNNGNVSTGKVWLDPHTVISILAGISALYRGPD